MIRAGLILLLSLLPLAGHAEPGISLISFDDLKGWDEDAQDQALPAFLESCDRVKGAEWRPLCAIAQQADDARAFFELFFQPVLIEDGAEMLFTAYYEPELRGGPSWSPTTPYPVYRMPPEARETRPWLTRRQIEEGGVMNGRGLEIAYVSDPVDLFFLQIQGSGRIRMQDGSVIRVGYGGSNGHPYSSVGERLVARGIYEAHQVSAKVIRNWVRANPIAGMDLLRSTDSYVFFREVNDVPADKGPVGAMLRSLTAGRSLAVDPAYTPLGAPVWIEKQGVAPMQRLMVAQDTGSKIKGAQRADVFLGTGAEAGAQAQRVKDGGRMVVLLPIQSAYAMLPDRLE